MCDVINFARRQFPAIALVTTDFRNQGRFIARASGMPEVPRIVLPHPIAGSGAENMKRVADQLVDTLKRVFDGELKGEIELACDKELEMAST